MAEVKWIKIMTDIFDDEKILLIDGLPERDGIIVIWFKLLCMAGKQNNDGVFLLNDKVAYTDEMLATIFRRPIATVRLALQTFEQFGMIEVINNTITIPNWNKHQSLDRLAEIREYNRLAQQKSRAKRKALQAKPDDINDKSMTSQRCHDTEEDKDKEEDKKEESKNIKAAKPTFDDILSEITSEELKQTYRDYIDMRKNIRSPLTRRALQLLINKVDSLETSIDGKCALLETAILNNWKSVYPPKGEPSKPQNPRNPRASSKGDTKSLMAELQELYLSEE